MPASQTGPRYLSGGFIDCCTSMSACWLTVRVPSCGRSRSAISAMTGKNRRAPPMMASARVLPPPEGGRDCIPQAGGHSFRVEVNHLIERLDEEANDNRIGVLQPNPCRCR